MMTEITAIKNRKPAGGSLCGGCHDRSGRRGTAKEFNERLDFNGVVLTKLDGDTEGAALLSVRW